MSFYVLQELVSVQAGEPFRLLPFKPIWRRGKKIDVTRELAERFKLPHYSPPIKLGSHKETTRAGGHIKALEVRDDGVYAVPELNEEGMKAFARGDYKYHSPEILWSGALEDAVSGERIEAPLILGDALLHSPALGEEAALYCIERVEKEIDESSLDKNNGKEGGSNMTDQKIEVVELSVFEKAMGKFFPKKEDEDTISADALAAIQTEKDELQAKVDEMKAEQEKVLLLQTIKSEFTKDGAEEKYGAAYIELGESEEAAQMLASMSPEHREWVLSRFKAFTAQIKESELTSPKGTEDNAAPASPDVLHSRVLAYQTEHKVEDYNVALQAVISKDQEFAAKSMEVSK
jgi:hypothetical protein